MCRTYTDTVCKNKSFRMLSKCLMYFLRVFEMFNIRLMCLTFVKKHMFVLFNVFDMTVYHVFDKFTWFEMFSISEINYYLQSYKYFNNADSLK